MKGSDEDSFYLYSVGERPEALTLGSLVLEKYWQPLIARHYTHELLSGDELERHAWASESKNCKFHGRTRLAPGVGVSGADIINLNLAWKQDHERLVIARSGTRLTLKNPEDFLRAHVLTNAKAQAALKLWLSAARSQYVMNFKWARRPKVWLLTGLYALEGTRSIVKKGNSSDVSVGVSSSIIGALSGVPIGGSVSLGQGSSWEIQMEMDERHIWAAQYRLIDAQYIKMGKRGAELSIPTSMTLYKDILSVNVTRGAGDDGVEIALQEEIPTENEQHEDGQRSRQVEESEEAYGKRLEETIQIFANAPPELLQ